MKKWNYVLFLKKNITPINASILLIALFVLVLMRSWQESHVYSDQIIVEDLGRLQEIFTNIDHTCTIIGFEHHKNYIDFLNVTSFVGSEIGSMNVAHPERWQGPYLHDNPTVQEQLYQVIKTKKGYYIIPGDGVKLSNGSVMGKDILIDENTDVQTLIADSQTLSYKGNPLAVPLLKENNKGRQVSSIFEEDLLSALQFHYKNCAV